MSRLRVRCRRARSSLTPRTFFVTKRARRVRTHARARARHAFDSSNHRPLSPRPARCATALPPAPRPHRRPASATAPQPAAAPASPLVHTNTHLRAAPRRAGPRRRGCTLRSGATGRLARPQRPSPGTFLCRKGTHLTRALRQVGLLRRAGRAGGQVCGGTAGCGGPMPSLRSPSAY